MPKRTHLIFLMLFVSTIIAGYLLADYQIGLPEDAVAQYVGRDSCASCHQQQVELFIGSHHDMAMDYATPDSVLANFDNQRLEHFGITSRMFRDGDRYMIHTEGPDGTMQDFHIKYTFGVEPLQQYMVELEGGVCRFFVFHGTRPQKNGFIFLHPTSRTSLIQQIHYTGRALHKTGTLAVRTVTART